MILYCLAVFESKDLKLSTLLISQIVQNGDVVSENTWVIISLVGISFDHEIDAIGEPQLIEIV